MAVVILIRNRTLTAFVPQKQIKRNADRGEPRVGSFPQPPGRTAHFRPSELGKCLSQTTEQTGQLTALAFHQLTQRNADRAQPGVGPFLPQRPGGVVPHFERERLRLQRMQHLLGDSDPQPLMEAVVGGKSLGLQRGVDGGVLQLERVVGREEGQPDVRMDAGVEGGAERGTRGKSCGRCGL